MNLAEGHLLFLYQREELIRKQKDCIHEMDVIGWKYGEGYDILDISRADIYECKLCGKIEYD